MELGICFKHNPKDYLKCENKCKVMKLSIKIVLTGSIEQFWDPSPEIQNPVPYVYYFTVCVNYLHLFLPLRFLEVS